MAKQQRKRWLKPHHWGIAATSQTATAGRVMLLLVDVENDCKADGVYIINAATIAGNVTVGLYGPVATEDTCLGSAVLVQSASTALSGSINSAQLVTFTETYLKKGRYYIAIEYSDATHTYMRQSNQQQVLGFIQFYDRGGGYGTLTDPCPAVTNTGSAAPGVVLRVTA